MRGIAGIICRTAGAAPAKTAENMAKCLAHETGDISGVYANNTLGVAVGWVCRQSDVLEQQPFWNEARDICLFFAGEDFTDEAEINALRARGHQFGLEDASYVVHQYEETGSRAFEKLNGWFSGVLVDIREGVIILFNDRYGLNRIYYHENAQGLYFSSEAKSILNVLPHLRELDAPGLGEFFSCGCILQNRSLFPGINLLPGASAWTFQRDGKISKAVYFKPETWEEQAPLGAAAYDARLEETFARILPRYFRGKRHLAASLTGGLDGRMIMAWCKAGAGTLPCYTFGSSYRDCADVRIAREIARECRQPHQVITVAEDFLKSFPQLAERTVYITDGTMDVTGAAELYVNRKGREIAPIRLTGNYGSEILRGNVAFRPGEIALDIFSSDFKRHVQGAALAYGQAVRGNPRSFIAFKQVPWHHHARFALEQSQLTVRSPYLDNDLVALAFQRPAERETSVAPALRLIADGNPRLGKIPTDRGIVFQGGEIRNRVRRSVEAFLIKAEYAYDYGMPAWLARVDHLLAPLKLERLFLGRQKFCHYRVWYRDQLAPYVKQVLLDSRSLSRPYLDRRRVEKVVAGHLAGTHNFTLEIHKLLTVELLHRQLIDQQ